MTSNSSYSSRTYTPNNGDGTIKLTLRLDGKLIMRLLFLMCIGCLMLSSTVRFIKSEINSIASTKKEASNVSKINSIINQHNNNLRRLSSANVNKNTSDGKGSNSKSKKSQQQAQRLLLADNTPKIIQKKLKSKHKSSKLQFLDYNGDSDKHKQLDFLIAGFPKCGTTTLLYTFNKHKETSIS